MGKMVWDVSRAIDYLESLPGVDKDRIGCIGHSHGAYGTIFAMALDERLKVGVASCGFTTFRTDPRFERWYRLTALLPRLGFYEGHVRDTPIDFHHILSLIAPRPFFNSAALDVGIFPRTENMPWVNVEVKQVYGLHGAADAYDSYVFKGGHQFPPEARDQAYTFLDKWLKGK